MNLDLIYLATPYYNEGPLVMQDRFERVTKVAALLTEKGYNVYSPITHNHPVAQLMESVGNYRTWIPRDFQMIQHCKKMLILTLPGWEESKGLEMERIFCASQNIPMYTVDLEGVERVDPEL